MLRCDMLLVGLTGGLASGKTTIAQLFQQLGAQIIDADQIARQVVCPKRSAWKEIVRIFGRDVLTSDNQVNRSALAHVVFHTPAKLKQLTDILYPRVAREQARLTQRLYRENRDVVIIYEAAMLIESGAFKRMDRIIVVMTTQHTQIQRATQRTSMSKAEARRRIRCQLPVAEKLQYADHVIDGTLPRDQLRRVVRQLYAEFQDVAKQ
ncbi:MAG: dephospho-CoA kinase [Nitrospirales bacterium]|nr:dephospho-CoA kinase [Nitrospira sp.]MDR4502656.1 dephospho-CoA kinase [Nitrospirales bacterium]